MASQQVNRSAFGFVFTAGLAGILANPDRA